MAKYASLAALFEAIADAIRAKTGSTADIVAENFPEEIANIPTGTSGGLKVNSIVTTSSGTTDRNTSVYHGNYWAAIDDSGNLLLVVEGGTSTSYESIRFMATSLPEGITLVNQSYYSYASMGAGLAYVAVFSGLTKSVDITLDFYDVYASTDYVYCGVTITEVT